MGSSPWDPHAGLTAGKAHCSPSRLHGFPTRCLALAPQVGAGAPLHGGECCVELHLFAQVGLAKHKPAKKKQRVLLKRGTPVALWKPQFSSASHMLAPTDTFWAMVALPSTHR